MAYNKNKKRFKKFSPLQKFNYHSSRYYSPKRHGIRFGSLKHTYSVGFVDAFHAINNYTGIVAESGKKAGKAYLQGNKRGWNTAYKYKKTTGKDPKDLRYKTI